MLKYYCCCGWSFFNALLEYVAVVPKKPKSNAVAYVGSEGRRSDAAPKANTQKQ